MKAKVLRPFRDKHTKEVYKKGQTIEVTKKRLAEIDKNLGDGYIEAVSGVTPGTEKTSEKPGKGKGKKKQIKAGD